MASLGCQVDSVARGCPPRTAITNADGSVEQSYAHSPVSDSGRKMAVCGITPFRKLGYDRPMLTPHQIRTMPSEERVRRIRDLLATAALQLLHGADREGHVANRE